MIAAFHPEQGITVWGSLQCPLLRSQGPDGIVRIKRRRRPSCTNGNRRRLRRQRRLSIDNHSHAALLAMKSARPVKIIYDRTEDMTATTKRHPSRTRHRTAVSKDGKFSAVEAHHRRRRLRDSVLRGPLARHHPGWRSLLLAEHPHSRKSPSHQHAAPRRLSRLFGDPASLFAMERHMDHIAQTVGLTPIEIRRRNFLKQGRTTTTNEPSAKQ